jgi:succinate dehydrogenase / fumarate reductase membrane anchor subunit
MATPLARVRGQGTAHRGTETFWRQRLTALINIPLILFLVMSILNHIGADYETVRSYFARPAVTVLMLALVISVSLHMRIGLKEIIEDYVHGHGVKIAAIVLATIYAWGLGLASAYALLKIGLGS